MRNREISIDIALRIVLHEMMCESALSSEDIEKSLRKFKRMLAEKGKSDNGKTGD